MGNRLDLQALLEFILGSTNVYFQPPETVKMKYPCIVFARNSARTLFADNKPYNYKQQYMVKVIDKNPDSESVENWIWDPLDLRYGVIQPTTTILDKVAQLPMCIFDRHYTADNLNHDVFNLYY